MPRQKRLSISAAKVLIFIPIINLPIIIVNKLRIKIDKLCMGLEGLAEHGPLRPEALRGLTTAETYDPAIEMMPKELQCWAYPKTEGDQRYNTDKTGYRTGIAPPEHLSKRITDEVLTAKGLIHARNADAKKCMSVSELKECIDILRGMVMIAYPAYHGLPEWDPVYEICEEKCDFMATYPDCEVSYFFC